MNPDELKGLADWADLIIGASKDDYSQGYDDYETGATNEHDLQAYSKDYQMGWRDAQGDANLEHEERKEKTKATVTKTIRDRIRERKCDGSCGSAWGGYSGYSCKDCFPHQRHHD
jgi:hypothetical protein